MSAARREQIVRAARARSNEILREYVTLLLEMSSSPRVIFMAGAPGSGKSHVIKKLGIDKRLSVVNPDDQYERDLAREGIPMNRSALFVKYKQLKSKYTAALEMSDGETAREVEPEYSNLRAMFSKNMALFAKARRDAQATKEIAARAGEALLIDGTGGNYREIHDQVTDFQARGYKIGMIFVDVPIEIAIERNARRASEGGRSIEDDDIIRSWNSVNANIERYARLFDPNFFRIDAELDEFDRSIARVRPKLEKFLR